MREIAILLRPRVKSIRHSILTGSGSRLKLLLFGTIGVLFWSGLFAITLRVLQYFKGIEEIGDMLSMRLLSMILITSLALLIFSSLLTSLSRLYMSRDLHLVHATPVPASSIFMARWIDSTIESSWMVAVFTFPVFLSFGIVYQTGPLFYVTCIACLICLSVTASAVSALVIIGAVLVVPANRMKNIFIVVGVLFFVVIYLAIRLLKPETLVDPEVFESVLVYISSLQTPSSPFLPSTWAFDSIRSMLHGTFQESIFHTGLAGSFSGLAVVTLFIVADRFYFQGYSKTQTASVRVFTNSSAHAWKLPFVSTPVSALIWKEIKTFFRDQTQWSQLFLIAALTVIYIYNFKVLPLERSPIKTIYLQNLFSFLNMGLALFVLTAIAGRFVFPSVSIEREAFWVIRTAPIRLRKFLWIKFAIFLLPLLFLTELLTIVTNVLLNVTPFMMWLSFVTVFFVVPGVVSLGVGLGAAYPDFKAENPAQTVTGFGGLLFMMASAAYIGTIIILQAGPVYRIFMAGIHGRGLGGGEWVWAISAFSAAAVISLLMIVLPLRYGEKRLREMGPF